MQNDDSTPPPSREKEGPLAPEVATTMQKLARVCANELPKTHGFALLVFDFHVAGRTSYISNAQRADMRTALRELLDKWDRDASS